MNQKITLPKRLLLILTVLFLGKLAHSQVYISGPECSNYGSTTPNLYIADGLASYTNFFNWSVTGGYFLDDNGNSIGRLYNGSRQGVLVVWEAGTQHQIEVNCSEGHATLDPYMVPQLHGGAILSSTIQIIDVHATPYHIRCSLASGGFCDPLYEYQWLMSFNRTDWVAINNQNEENLIYPLPLTQTTYFKRSVREQNSNTTAYSDEVAVLVNPLVGGTITPGSMVIRTTTSPSLSATAASGGNCSAYTYQWQQSIDNVSFTDIPNQAGLVLNLQPGVDKRTFFRLKVTCGSEVAYTNVCTVDVDDDMDVSKKLNTIKVWDIKKPGVTTITDADQLTDPADVNLTTQFLDGLGRPLQTVSRQASPLQKDVVSFNVYDELGRAPAKFLPYVSPSSDGTYKPEALVEQKAFYSTQFPGEQFFYSQVSYEASPLSRVEASFAPGTSWAGSKVGSSVQYDYNSREEKVHIWNIDYNPSALPTTSPDQVYETGKLSKLTSLDEKGKKVITYTDLSGNTILKKVQEKAGAALTGEHEGWVCTYYVYDDFNQLRYTIPAKAVEYLDRKGWNLTQGIADELCFKYVYDERGRAVVKKQPGAKASYMIYDNRDRLVFTQDAGLKEKGQWLATLYDALDRQVLTGLLTYAATPDLLQEAVNNQGSQSGVVPPADIVLTEPKSGSFQATSSIILQPGFESGKEFKAEIDPNSGSRKLEVQGVAVQQNLLPDGAPFFVLTITHYDNYDYTGAKPFTTTYSFAYNSNELHIETTAKTNRTRGLVTGEKIRIVDNDNDPVNDRFILSTAYYDERGRTLQSLSDNIKEGTDYQTNQYDFTGKLMSSFLSHSVSGASPFTVISKLQYDKGGRLINLWKNFNNALIDGTAYKYKWLAEYSYDELGQLKTKRLAPGYFGSGKEEMEKQTFDYNIHGSLTGINKEYALSEDNSDQWDQYFGMYLGYDNRDGRFAAAQYDGSITGVIWKSQGDNSMRKYDYTYDNLGRFTSAIFHQKKKPSDSWSNTELDFSVYASYEDGNGNLRSLKQMSVLPGQGVKAMDDLSYRYKEITDAPDLTGNQLMRVTDNGEMGDDNGIFGDFKDGSNAGDDYDYDDNGNLQKDFNKNITEKITYNYLNKPLKIVLQNKSEVEYTYDASGEKLSKKVTNTNTQTSKTTYYIGDFVYEENELQYILHEEGRIKIITSASNDRQETNAGASGLNLNSLGNGKQGVFEYFLKDHLGNTRMVLTEEVQKEFYTATMESTAATSEEPFFGDINRTSGNWEGNSSQYVKLAALNSNSKTTGPGMILRVMAGDRVSTRVRYYFKQLNAESGDGDPVSDMVTSLVGALSGSTGSVMGKGGQAAISSTLKTNSDLGTFITSPQVRDGENPNAPRAYLNIVFLDEQFNFVELDYGSTGAAFKRVNDADANNPNASMAIVGQRAPKNGWAYVYLSNESREPVSFDDFEVSQEHGRIAEETHYYPHGLKIAPLSSRAINKLENKYGYQGDFSEEEEETGWNEFDLRMYDPQIGRWTGADPYDQFASPYVGMGNDPVNNIDPDGGLVGDPITLPEVVVVGYLPKSVSAVSNTLAETIVSSGARKVSQELSKWSVEAGKGLVKKGWLSGLGGLLSRFGGTVVAVFTPLPGPELPDYANGNENYHYNRLRAQHYEEILDDPSLASDGYLATVQQRFYEGIPTPNDFKLKNEIDKRLRAGKFGIDGGQVLPDLVKFRRTHILNRHRSGTGIPGKTEFPATWSDEKIINEINKIANDPNAPSGIGKYNSPYKIGIVEGIEIRVDFYPSNHPTYAGQVSTGYPTNVPANP